jgi:hypothetical protein
MNGYISIADAAKAAGLTPRAMRKLLKRKHKHLGGVLFRLGEGRNSKFWTTPGALQRIMPERFGTVTELDLLELRQLSTSVERRLSLLERRVRR